MPDLSEVTLENLHGGAAVELFQKELYRVLENIQDPNTNPEAKRSLTMKVTFEPDEERERADITLEVVSKLASHKPVRGPIYMGQKDGRPVAAAFDPNQPDFFQAQDPQIHPMKKDVANDGS
jgi:hypothetical protein